MANGVSIDDFGASFIHYLPGVIQTLNNTSRARLLPKGTLKWEGLHLEKKLHVTSNGSISFPEDGGPIKAAGSQAYVASKAYRKNCTGSVKVTDGILNNAKTTRNAAITVVESELEGMLNSIRKLENYILTRDGTGIVTQLGSTVSGATLTVDDARLLHRFARSSADYTILDTDLTTTHTTFQVSRVARAFTNNEATVTTTASVTAAGQADGDHIVWGTGAHSAYGRWPTGLDALIDDGTGTFQGVDVTTYNHWTSPVLSNGGTLRALTPSLLRQLMAAVKQESGEDIDSEMTLLGCIWQGINFEEMFEGEVRITETTKVGGIEISKFQSTLGSLQLVMDPDAPYGKLFLVDFSQITRAVQAELDWRGKGDTPGSIFHTLHNGLQNVATCLETYEFFIEGRNKCGKIEDLRETRATAF